MRISDWSSDVCSSDLQDCTLHSSSFGGLGESCAVAIETLNVLQSERLIENAAAMGEYLSEGLNDLKRKYPKIVLDEIGRASCRERSVSVRVDLGGRRIIKKKKIR